MKTLVLVWVLGMLLFVAARTYDPVAEAWACRCDTCCAYLEEVWK